MKAIDLNADVGEIPGAEALDASLMEHVTSVNVACGGHAGDEGSIEATVRAALARGVAVGAHPSFPDREGFGRRPMALSVEAVAAAVEEQVRRFSEVACRCGARMTHVKPHGALYNAAARDATLAGAIALGVGRVTREAVLVGLAGSVMLEVFAAAGYRVAPEAFADRGYEADGSLTPRALPGALHTDPALAAAQAVAIARDGVVRSREGGLVLVVARTLCVHADTPGALEIVRAVALALRSEGIEIRSLEQSKARKERLPGASRTPRGVPGRH